MNTLKNKITLGLTFLLTLLILSGIIGVYNLYKLRNDSREIIKDNYETLSYCRSISELLDSLPGEISIKKIEVNIYLQENNITEKGEKEATKLLADNWQQAKSKGFPPVLISSIRKNLNEIQLLNLNAIERKNDLTEKTADRALISISAITVFIIMLAFIFLLRFPSIITKPLKQLLAGIQEITNKNYSYKIPISKDEEMAFLARAFNQMSERLHEYDKSNVTQLLFEKTRAEAVINSLKDAGIGIDLEGKILFANSEALLLLNLKADTILGKPVLEIARYNDLFNFIISTDQSTPFKIAVNAKDSFFTREKNEILGKSGTVGTLYTIKNITSFQEKDIAKTNFLATISHELKTPLSSTNIALKLLGNEKIGSLNAEQQKLVQDINNENQRLIKLVSELLDMSQVETGKINLNISASSLYEIIDYSLDALKTLIQEKNIRIKKEGFTMPIEIKADKEKSIWVLMNVLSNAIRYSPDNSLITIRIKKAGIDHTILSIQDNGPGIPPEYKHSIFQRFYKIPGSAKGTGLGLSIAKEFMEAMNGKIELDETSQQGSCFNLSFKNNL
jgi:NtrC-family two-component system sensor histidine kinase KinB